MSVAKAKNTTSTMKNPVPPRARITRIPATEVFPVIEQGLWPAKATEGESFPVRATVFREGHDALGSRSDRPGRQRAHACLHA